MHKNQSILAYVNKTHVITAGGGGVKDRNGADKIGLYHRFNFTKANEYYMRRKFWHMILLHFNKKCNSHRHIDVYCIKKEIADLQ